ncbi:hypothetical protein OKA04_23240 [Luteolibacter flavescens]|uniref:ATP-binding protein n=1 Tax=Luteolibacter flavescens TaxID=1859460 RepID=A0ABT3FVT9_9BACT|nr:hypothetical protein [Luteolibacter flavescens]MCW1887672.1 hypothetical protein [Luteolibacter flavescens]
MVEQLTVQPFFDHLGQACAPHAPGVNAAATARLERVLKSPVDAPGRGILLRAPRAGFGKSHLLSHLQQRLGTTHEFLPIHPVEGSRVDPAGAIEGALRRLSRPLPAGGGLTSLDLQARRLFALALQPLVSSGEVPCQDREAALSALRQRPVETFDFHHSQAVTAHWTKENFEVLGPRLALELGRLTGTSLNESSYWLAALFRFAVATPEHPGRTGMIIQSAIAEAGVERFAALLAMLSLIGRVVIVADDLEGLHADRAAALRFASFLASVRQEAPRVDAIVSLNDDVWQSAFEPALSGGLQDRLGEVEVRLEPMDEDALVSLLEARTPGRVSGLRQRLGLFPAEFYPRRVLRKVAELDDEGPEVPAVMPAALQTPAAIPAAAVEAAAAEPAPTLVPEPAMAATPAPAPERVDFVSTPEPAPALASTPEPAEASPITPPPLKEPAAKVESPFASEPVEAAPSFSAPAAASIAPKTPAEIEPAARPMVSPFAPDALEKSGEGETEAIAESKPAAEPVAAAGGDRIDDLLRQFRERYGRE